MKREEEAGEGARMYGLFCGGVAVALYAVRRVE